MIAVPKINLHLQVIALDFPDSTSLPACPFPVRILHVRSDLALPSSDGKGTSPNCLLSATLFPPLTGLPLYAILYGSYDSSMAGDLRAFFGDTVTVVAEIGFGWVEAVANGRRGRLPRIKLANLAEVRQKAECGHAEAQRELGLRYLFGRGVPKDANLAVPWFRKAAEQGFVWAQRNLAQQLGRGNGVARDDQEAVKWYLCAAEQNDVDSQYDLGVCYNKGIGVAPDKAEALRWFVRAAELGTLTTCLCICARVSLLPGDRDAQFFLATGYHGGIDVEQDYTKAIMWYRKAAEQDHAKAQFNLGMSLMRGVGLTKDIAEATKWFRLAAEQGLANAQQMLADLCMATDEGEAMYWYCKAAEQCNDKAERAVLNALNGGAGLTKLS